MTAANPFRRQNRSGQSAALLNCVHRINRARWRETAAAGAAKQKNLRGRNRPAIRADGQNQNVLERIHGSVLEQSRAAQGGQKILFHFGKTPAGNRVARHQNQFHRLGEFMLVLPETFAEQPPGAVALDGAADFFAGDHAELRRGTVGQFVPIRDETAEREALALQTHTREIAALRQARRAAQTQAFRRRGVHDIKPA